MAMEINSVYGSYVNPYTVPKNNSGNTENTEPEKFEKRTHPRKQQIIIPNYRKNLIA